MWQCNKDLRCKVLLQDFQFGDISEVEILAVAAAQRWQQLAEEQVHLWSWWTVDRLGGRSLPFCFNDTGDSVTSWHFTRRSNKICKIYVSVQTALDNCAAWLPPAHDLLGEKLGPPAPVFRFLAAVFPPHHSLIFVCYFFQGIINEWKDWTCRTSAGQTLYCWTRKKGNKTIFWIWAVTVLGAIKKKSSDIELKEKVLRWVLVLIYSLFMAFYESDERS